jgi:hypothetical protein
MILSPSLGYCRKGCIADPALGSDGGGLAEEIVLFDGGEGDVGVSRAHQAQLVGIHAESVFQLAGRS